MNVFLNGLNQTAAAGLAALLNTLWYAAGVVALTWVVLRFSRRVNAATRYWIWTAVLGFLVVLPFLPALVAHVGTASAVAPAAAPLATVPVAPQAAQRLAPVTFTLSSAPGSTAWPLWLLAVWIAVAGWQLVRLMRGIVSVRRLKGHSDKTPTDELPIQLRRRVQVLASEEINSPVAVGYRHPAVIVPTGLLASLEEDERKNVLLHELAHLARYDDWLNLATRAVGAILVLHPLAGIVLKQIEREREMACDDFVVAHTGSARNYARSLARLHDLHSTEGTRLLAPALLGGKVSLADRLESLLRRQRKFSARPSLANLGVSAFLLILLLGAGGLIPGWVAIAQTAPPESLAEMQKSACRQLPKSFCAALPTAFEVASIRPSDPKKVRRIGYYERFSAARFIALDWSPERLIYMAYRLRPEQLDGLPSWAKSRLYDIQGEPPPKMGKAAKALGTLPADERQDANKAYHLSELQMLQSLLVERFQLKVHRETRQLPVYELVVAKHGPKLKSADKPYSGWSSGPGMLTANLVSMDYFANLLSTNEANELGRIVINRTHLMGKYYIKLKWKPFPHTGVGMAMDPGSPPSSSRGSGGPSIFTAIKEQLGLKLKPAKGPVQVLVVDHISLPTPN